MGRNAWCAGALAILGFVLDVGAASNQVETLLYDTHRKVTNLNKNLDGAIKKLNQTTSELVGRVESSEEQTRRLRSMVEENQVKLDSVEQQLGELTATIYQQFNLTTSSSGYSPVTTSTDTSTDTIAIEPPSRESSTSGSNSAPVTPANVVIEDPAAIDTEYRKAQLLWQNADYGNALPLFTNYVARYPNSVWASSAQYWEGRCHLSLENYQQAIDAFEKVRTNYPDNESKVSKAMQSGAVAHSRLGRNDVAEALLREVIEKYPSSSAARQAESDLEKLSGN